MGSTYRIYLGASEVLAMTKAYVLISADTAYAEVVAGRLKELNGVVAVHEVLVPMTLWLR